MRRLHVLSYARLGSRASRFRRGGRVPMLWARSRGRRNRLLGRKLGGGGDGLKGRGGGLFAGREFPGEVGIGGELACGLGGFGELWFVS